MCADDFHPLCGYDGTPCGGGVMGWRTKRTASAGTPVMDGWHLNADGTGNQTGSLIRTGGDGLSSSQLAT